MRSRLYRPFSFLIFLCALCSMPCALCYADTIYMRNGRELKGIVVEEYKDRLTFSTTDGEAQIMKDDIRELYLDSEEENLLMLAGQARDRRGYDRAFIYYEKVLKINPDSQAAKDGIVFLQGYLYRKNEAMKEFDVRRREEFERYGTVIGAAAAEERSFNESAEQLKRSLGITLAIRDVFPEIEKVENGSGADEAGIRKGDRLVAIWGRLTGYMPLTEIVKILIEKPLLEIKCTIERTVRVNVNSGGIPGLASSKGLIGASLSMEFEGLTVAGVMGGAPAAGAGIARGDLITAMDGKPTRYMPLKDAIELIKGSKGKSISITFRREITIWRRE